MVSLVLGFFSPIFFESYPTPLVYELGLLIQEGLGSFLMLKIEDKHTMLSYTFLFHFFVCLFALI